MGGLYTRYSPARRCVLRLWYLLIVIAQCVCEIANVFVSSKLKQCCYRQAGILHRIMIIFIDHSMAAVRLPGFFFNKSFLWDWFIRGPVRSPLNGYVHATIDVSCRAAVLYKLCVRHISGPGKNGWTDRDIVQAWQTRVGPGNHVLDWGCTLASPCEYGRMICTATEMRAFATITVAT